MVGLPDVPVVNHLESLLLIQVASHPDSLLYLLLRSLQFSLPVYQQGNRRKCPLLNPPKYLPVSLLECRRHNRLLVQPRTLLLNRVVNLRANPLLSPLACPLCSPPASLQVDRQVNRKEYPRLNPADNPRAVLRVNRLEFPQGSPLYNLQGVPQVSHPVSQRVNHLGNHWCIPPASLPCNLEALQLLSPPESLRVNLQCSRVDIPACNQLVYLRTSLRHSPLGGPPVSLVRCPPIIPLRSRQDIHRHSQPFSHLDDPLLNPRLSPLQDLLHSPPGIQAGNPLVNQRNSLLGNPSVVPLAFQPRSPRLILACSPLGFLQLSLRGNLRALQRVSPLDTLQCSPRDSPVHNLVANPADSPPPSPLLVPVCIPLLNPLPCPRPARAE